MELHVYILGHLPCSYSLCSYYKLICQREYHRQQWKKDAMTMIFNRAVCIQRVDFEGMLRIHQEAQFVQ